MEGQVEAQLMKVLAIEPAPPTNGPADPATKANDTADGDVAGGKALPLPDDSAQGRRKGLLVKSGALLVLLPCELSSDMKCAS